MKFLFMILLLPTLLHAKIISIYDTFTSQEVEYNNFLESMPSNGYIALGEFHNNEVIQSAQAKVIEDTIQLRRLFGNFNVGWEFLDYSDQQKINSLFRKVITNQMSIDEFLIKTAGRQNLSYSPIIQVVKNKSGNLVALNISRAIKQLLINEGEDAVADHLPFNYEVGGDFYKERFFNEMDGHVPDDMKLSYFKAQCLTDSVMALKIYENHIFPLSFIVAGSFHTDFYQGTISRLRKLTSERVATLKFVDSSIMTQQELQEILRGDDIYGYYADFIVVTAP